MTSRPSVSFEVTMESLTSFFISKDVSTNTPSTLPAIAALRRPEPILPASVSEQPTPIVVPKTTEASIHSCINNKVTDAESKIRQEIVRLGVAAGLGKLLACRTVIVNKEKSGNGPKSNEYLFGIPECFLVSAEVEDRAKIIECGTKNGKPHIEVEVKGKGCEFSNKATFEIVAKYKSKIDKNARELIEKECKEEY